MAQLKNNKGFTLLEVLAVIVIGSIVSILVWSAFNNSVKTYHKTSQHIDLRQEANILVETLSNLHKRKETLNLQYDRENKKLYINEDLFNKKNYKIDVSFRGPANEDLFGGSNRITNLQEKKLLRLHLQLYDDIGNKYEIQTTISRL
ncbi:prepilin-type N-terminal cleavage/methylation domain-containing protein [Bacillus fengqiuensis]|nr:prepilin-type N-terminal cleavage/methylation domain-containing protein [Bacillus fengqiuensis]